MPKPSHSPHPHPHQVKRALVQFQHNTSTRPEHSPYPYTPIVYGRSQQLIVDKPPPLPLTPREKTWVQELVGTFLWYGRAIDGTMLAALSSFGAAAGQGDITTIKRNVTQFLNYAATHPDAKIVYTASEMNLWAHSDASYLCESKARSRAGAFASLSSKPKLPILAEATLYPANGPILMVCKIIDAVMSSAQEAETAAGFLTAKELVPVRQTLIEMGHPQGPTPLQFDNKCATGIMNDTVRQKRSKAMDMRHYWLRDRVRQNQFHVYWKPGTYNLGDYPTKHHPTKHHINVRPSYVANYVLQ